MKFLRLLGNIIWFCTFGLLLFISEIIASLFSIVTIVPIFFGIPWVHLNNAKYFIAPFGKRVKTHFGGAPIRNIFSFIFGGFFGGLMLIMFACIFCITIIGIPVGKILFGAAKLTIAPFHAEIVKI